MLKFNKHQTKFYRSIMSQGRLRIDDHFYTHEWQILMVEALYKHFARKEVNYDS